MEPEEIERKEFLVSLRGYDRDEVDTFMREMAEEIRALKAAPGLPEEPVGPDKQSAYRQVGEDTAKILLAAEEAGSSIRERANQEAAGLLTDARAKAQEVERQSAEERQAAEEDLRRLREARSILGTQLLDVRKRLDEIISRLEVPLDTPPEPRRARARKAEEAAPVAAAPTMAAAPTVIEAPPKVEAEPRPEPAAAPIATAPEPAPATVDPAPAPAPVEAPPEGEAAPAAASPVARLQGLLEEARREREAARREIDDVLSAATPPARTFAPAQAPAPAPTPSVTASTMPEVQVQALPTVAESEVLANRDRELGDLPPTAARRLKLTLQEDENDVLDRIRISRGKGSFEKDISLPEVQLTRFKQSLGEYLEAAFLAGRRAKGATGHGNASITVGDLIGKQIVNPLRKEVGRVVDAGFVAQDTPTSIAGRASDVFRVWKGVRTELLGQGLALSAYHHGLVDAWREAKIVNKRWVASSNEGDCPKGVCASNAAAGAVALDSPFPSGHLAPPAHGGCTCSLSE